MERVRRVNAARIPIPRVEEGGTFRGLQITLIGMNVEAWKVRLGLAHRDPFLLCYHLCAISGYIEVYINLATGVFTFTEADEIKLTS
jgi:hypothetical protein